MWVVGICASLIGLLIGITISGYFTGHKYCLKLWEQQRVLEKHMTIIRMYDAWMMIKQEGKRFDTYLKSKGINSVAIYGMDYKGIRLFHELKNSDINIVCGIDRSPQARVFEIEILSPDEVLPKDTDAIIVTACLAYDGIKKDLQKRGFDKIFALDELIFELM